MVNIIMPAYNAHNTIRQAIGSVVMQDGLENIWLTIVDDCSDEPYDYLLNDFHYMNIEILRKPTNTGCGQSRQYGIDRCQCEYFMFLDADDCLYSHDAVKKMYSYMKDEQLDFLYSDFIEEINDDEYILHQNSGVWMHGKIFRTEYIKNNNIRYSETRLHEDHAFNIIVNASGGKNLYIDYTTYVWKNNPDSLTHSKNHTFDYAMENFIANAEYVLSELKTRNIDEQIFLKVIKTYILSFYRYYNQALDLHLAEESLGEYLKKISIYFCNIPGNLKKYITKEFLMEDFYDNSSIQGMLDSNLVFRIGFDEYYSLVSKLINT